MKANKNNEIKNDDLLVRINYGLSMIFVGIMALITVVFIALYPNVGKNVNKHFDGYNDQNFFNDLGKTNYALLDQTTEKPNHKELMINNYLDLSKISTSDQELVKSDFTKVIDRYKNNLKDNLLNLEYYAVNNESNKTATNNQALASAIKNANVQSLTDGYDFYLVYSVNEKGLVNIDYVKGADQEQLENYLNNFVNNREFTVYDYFRKKQTMTVDEWNRYEHLNEPDINYEEDTQGNVTIWSDSDTSKQFPDYGDRPLLKPVKNMTYVYAVKENLTYYDSIYSMVNYSKRNLVEMLTALSILAAMALMAFITMVLPYRNERVMAATRVVLRIPVEILAVLIGFSVVGVVFTVIGVLPFFNSTTVYQELQEIAITGTASDIIIYGVQFICVFLCLTAAVFMIMIIKNMFHIGIIKYLKENCLIIRLIRWNHRKIKGAFRFFTTLDLSKEETKKLVLLLVVHGAITFFLCCIWIFGAFLSIAYNLVIFVILRKRYLEIQKDYSTLSAKTKIIADGNLETSIEEELGIFNPLKEDINHIKDGLKNAVEEEVKSQSLKTELITNVSHDLKTPLTSIITYVDLLKDPALTKEQQGEYIDILDRKSQRLKVLIEDLFEMSKTTTKNIVLNYQNLDLVTLTKEVFVEFQDKLEEVPLMVKNEFQKEHVICYLDSQRTYRILENLYGNLIKYAMPNTRVYVSVAEQEDKGIITVKNISANELNFDGSRLMERFVRGDVSRNTEGSGLGLAIAKGLVEAQGGTMKVEIDGDLFKVIVAFPISQVKEEIAKQPEFPKEEKVTDNQEWLKQFYEQTEKVELSEDDETLGE
ncbi:MAG: HAMP domain-containing sensor histidine kinase [bacterium]|nr:HAMP domain-containing sensor histidine kinase [bacterium]